MAFVLTCCYHFKKRNFFSLSSSMFSVVFSSHSQPICLCRFSFSCSFFSSSLYVYVSTVFSLLLNKHTVCTFFQCFFRHFAHLKFKLKNNKPNNGELKWNLWWRLWKVVFFLQFFILRLLPHHQHYSSVSFMLKTFFSFVHIKIYCFPARVCFCIMWMRCKVNEWANVFTKKKGRRRRNESLDKFLFFMTSFTSTDLLSLFLSYSFLNWAVPKWN